ncbi:hypothetical protein BJX66DRAFT_344018 [Aspergillus keveii]|uniref:Uncharacterized protein n=1 Tax=Aspergillus keveii TaxID=714993 RepID=A0ABR4FN45_9EURO
MSDFEINSALAPSFEQLKLAPYQPSPPARAARPDQRIRHWRQARLTALLCFNKLRSLWGFLRTLVESSKRADHVHELWLTTFEIFEPFQLADTEEATQFITKYIPFPVPNDYVLDQPPADQRSRSHWARFWKAAYGTALYYQHKEWITETLQRAINDRAWLEHHKGG